MNRYPEWLYRENQKYTKADIESHERQRVETGVSFYDWINFNTYVSHIMVEGIDRFLNNGCGHPGLLTEEEWDAILMEMRYGFDLMRKEKEDVEGYAEATKRSLELLSEWFYDLWD